MMRSVRASQVAVGLGLFTLAAFATATTACNKSPASGSRDAGPLFAAPPSPQAAEVPVVPSPLINGPAPTCSGLVTRPLSAVASDMLNDRIRLHSLEGSRILVVGQDMKEPTPPIQTESRLAFDEFRTKVVVVAYELFRTASPKLEDDARVYASRELADYAPRIDALQAGRGAHAVMFTPGQVGKGPVVLAGGALIATPDNLLQYVAVYVDAASTVGDFADCTALAGRILSTIEAGDVNVPRQAATRALDADPTGQRLVADLPADYLASPSQGAGSIVYTIHKLGPLAGATPPVMGIYVGSAPKDPPTAETTSVPGQLFGKPVEWAAWSTHDARETQLHLNAVTDFPASGPPQKAQIWVSAPDPASRDAMAQVAQTLRIQKAATP